MNLRSSPPPVPDSLDLRHLTRAVEIPTLEKPKLGRYGWTPSTSRFTDKGTGDTVNVLIDHILVSQRVKVKDHIVWNPFLDHKDDATKAKVDAVRDALKAASDHFPVSVVLEL